MRFLKQVRHDQNVILNTFQNPIFNLTILCDLLSARQDFEICTLSLMSEDGPGGEEA